MTDPNSHKPISPSDSVLTSPAQTSSTHQSLSRFSWHQEWIFILKELRETLRDRRTIVTLLAMPLLLYPLLGLGFRFLAFQESAKAVRRYEVAANSESEASRFSELMSLGKLAMSRESTGEYSRALDDRSIDKSIQTADPSSEHSRNTVTEPEVMISVPNVSAILDLEQLVQEGRADVGVRLREVRNAGPSAGIPSVQLQLVVNRNSMASLQVADFIATRLEAAEREINGRWMRDQQIEIPDPVVSERLFVTEAPGESSALSMLPLILLLMTVTGGVYPAIDLTAGERERNTLETLISLPVPKLRLLLAKFVAVVTVTMLTGLMNLLAMFVTLFSLQLDTVLLGEQGFTLILAIKLFCVLSVFALFYSAVLLFLTSSARSFKEAQAYLIPLLLLSIGPGLIILIPGWTLGPGSAVAPLVNILLLSRDLLVGQASFLPAAVSLISTLLYGLAALCLAAQVFGTDAVAVGSRSLWRDFLRRPEEERPIPTAGLVTGGLAVLFPAYFIASGMMSRGSEISPLFRLSISAALTVVLFLGIPWILLRWQRVPIVNGLAVRQTRWGYWLVAVLLGLSTWPLIFELIVLSHSIGFQSLDVSRFEEVQKLLDAWASVPLIAILLSMAVAPGVCEEVFFRGFLFGGLRQVLNRWTTVVVTAVVFGLFHFVLAGGAAPERILPSTLMGLLLGWIRLRSNSLLPGIVLHTVHNASLLTIAQYREELAGWGLGGLHETHLPLLWIITAGLVTVGCLIALQFLMPSLHTKNGQDKIA